MRLRLITILAIAILCLAPTASWADLAPYSQDFEGLDQGYEWALADDGWLVYGNIFGNPDWNWWYGHGPWGAPNHVYGFSKIAVGEGGPAQGEQQLDVYSDYNNGLHGAPAWIESNVYNEMTIGAADVGSTWRFEFDAKRGNIDFDTTASAFIKTFNAGWGMTNFIQNPMTDIPDTWDTYKIDVYIHPGLEGGVLQFGFVNWATWWRPSGIFYDNVSVELAPMKVSFDLRPEGCPNPLNTKSQGLLTAAVMGTADFDVNTIDVATLRLEGVAPVHVSNDDVGTPFGGDLCGCNAAGPDGFMDLTFQFDTQEFLAAIGGLPRGYTVLTLTGTLLDGTEFEGEDCTVAVGGGGRQSAAQVERMSTKSRRLPGDDEGPSGAVDLEFR
jgi:hypothetical protein